MKLRRSSILLGMSTVIATFTWLGSCSSGLGHNLRPTTGAPSNNRSANLPVGLDLGLTPTDPVASPAIAGVRLPAIGVTAAREVALLAFSTAAASDNGDGNGAPLSRDTTSDSNGASDVFVAAVTAQDIDTSAFSQSLAGKFRHPRCATCHSMQRADTLAFVSSPLPHAGPPPGPTFPNNAPQVCAPCHVDSTNFPVVGWQAPAASFDMRSKTVAQLALMAQNVPVDQTEHFVHDPRVLWALDSGILPAVNGRNGIADDNQNGIFEPEDVDGIPRTVPGGSANFIAEIQAWRNGGMVVTNAVAVNDVTLVSRAAGTNNAGNGASGAPRVVWVPNGSFNPSSSSSAFASNPIGTLYVAYESAASDLVAGDANGAQDVFRAAIQLRAEENATGTQTVGALNLVYLDSTVLCSAINGTSNAGDAASGHAVIGGSNAEWVAFESQSSNLTAGFTDSNGTGADIFLRDILTSETFLVSHTVGNAAIGGNGASERPTLDAAGTAIAFESDASDLVASDTNGVRDVFHARADTGSPFTKVRDSVTDTGAEGTGGGSTAASIYRSGTGRVMVAFQSDATNLAPSLTAATNVYLFDSATGFTTLLNQRIAPSGNAIGDGVATAPVITPDGSIVAFESFASNIDVVRPGDINHDGDIFLVETAQVSNGNVLPYRASITATESADANGSSTSPTVGNFTGSDNFKVGVLAYTTNATNLGTSDSTNLMISFLNETSGVIADFSATPLSGPAPLQVQFTDASSGLPTGWQWDFENDGTIDSAEQNPARTFSTPGNYTVRLVASNSNSTGTKTATTPIRVFGPVTADFSTSTASGNLPLTVIFTDTSTEPFGSIVSWAWDFDNDGTIDATTQNPSFDYVTEGTFSVTLTVTGEGGTGTVTKTGLIVVGPAGPITANFTSAQSGYNDQSIAFTDTSTGAVTDWAWDFGDGGTSTQQNPSHTFATPGTFTVVLVASGFGVNDSETKVNWFTSVPASESLTLTPTADNTIYQELTGNSNGGGTGIFVGRTLGSLTQGGVGPAALSRRGLLQFNVSAIPSGSTVLSSSVDLTFAQSTDTGSQAIGFHRLNSAWSEGSSVGGGQGLLEAGTGATWLRRISPATSWGTAGGDFVASATASLTAGAGTSGGGTSGSLNTDVQAWVDGTTNNGWLLKGVESSTGTVKLFASREAASGGPVLHITYRRPLP